MIKHGHLRTGIFIIAVILSSAFAYPFFYQPSIVVTAQNTSFENKDRSNQNKIGANSEGETNATNIPVAEISAIASVSAAALTGLLTIINQRKIASLDIQKIKENARTTYEYEARKNLYEKFEPILFTFSESCDNAMMCIFNLVQNAREERLGPKINWLSSTPNKQDSASRYLYETTYYLLAPMAIFKCLQNRLTFIDLELDQHINLKYLIAKEIYSTFTQHRYLAKCKPKLDYDPKEVFVVKDEKIDNYYQGISLSTLDIISYGLIDEEGESGSVISLSKFLQKFGKVYSDKQIGKKDEAVFKAMERFIKRFRDFHPNKRPVLWRTLLTQLWLYQCFKIIRAEHKLEINSFKSSDKMYEFFKNRYNDKIFSDNKIGWKPDNQRASDSVSEEFYKIKDTDPLSAVEEYLKSRLSDIYETHLTPTPPSNKTEHDEEHLV